MLSMLHEVLRALRTSRTNPLARRAGSSRHLECELLESRNLLSSYHSSILDDHAHTDENTPPTAAFVTTPPIAPFTSSGYKWDQSSPGAPVTITYSFHSSFLNDLNIPGNTAQAAIREALALWSRYAPLEFVEVADAGPNPSLGVEYSPANTAMMRFGAQAHDGSFGLLAFAYYPHNQSGLGGDLVFDSLEEWSTHPSSGVDILEVATHEIGHALGLGHESFNEAILNANYNRRFNGLGSAFLFQDDINAIQSLYGTGNPAPQGPTPQAPIPQGPVPVGPSNPMLKVGDVNGDGVDDVITTEGEGKAPTVTVYDGRNGGTLASFLAYDVNFTGGINIEIGDIDVDGIDDIITSARAGGGPHLKVFQGGSFNEIVSFFAYDASFTGGVNLAVGDLNGDGIDDIFTAQAAGGVPLVQVFGGGGAGTLASFLAYDVGFGGGVELAVGDLDNDGIDDLITAAGPGGGPHIKVYGNGGTTTLASFFAYDYRFTGGVNLAIGDYNGDGIDDLVTAPKAGGGPDVRVFGGGGAGTLARFFAYDFGFHGGVNISTGDTDGDGRDDILTGAGAGGGPHVKVFGGGTGDTLASFFAYPQNFTGGVHVTAGDVDLDGLEDILAASAFNGIGTFNIFGGGSLRAITSLSSLTATPNRLVASPTNPLAENQLVTNLLAEDRHDHAFLPSHHHDHDGTSEGSEGWLVPHAFMHPTPARPVPHEHEAFTPNEHPHDVYFELADDSLALG